LGVLKPKTSEGTQGLPQKTCRCQRRCPGCARLRRAPGGMPATGEGAQGTGQPV